MIVSTGTARTDIATDIAGADAALPLPGAATRRYLAALRERGALDIDWSAAPTRHKRYPGAPRLALPWPPADATFCDGSGADAVFGGLLGDLLGLARTIWYHATDDEGRPEGVQPLLLLGRPAPSGGALYPVEAYLATGGEGGLPAALFHYDPVHHALERIRDGDHRPGLAEPCVGTTDAVLALTAVFGRSAFKYGDLAYRLACQETGVLLAQALAVSEGLGLSADIRLRYDDDRVDQLLGLDGEREATLAVVALQFTDQGASGSGAGSAHQPGPPPSGPVRRSNAPEPRPLPSGSAAAALHRAARAEVGSRAPEPDPLPSQGTAAALHLPARMAVGSRTSEQDPLPSQGTAAVPHLPARMAVGSPAPERDPLPSPDAAAALRLPARSEVISPQTARLPQICDSPASIAEPLPLPPAPPIHLANGVPHRASPPAGYRPGSIALPLLAAVLDAAAQPYPADLPGADRAPAATTLHLLALHVEGLPPGAYRYDRDRRVLQQTAGRLDAESAVAAARLLPNTRAALRTAAAAVIPVGDPLAGVAGFGDRWYRMQQIETGLVVHRVALAAAASGLAARIHSDGAGEAIDTLLGLIGSPRISVSFLLLGIPRLGGPTLARRFPRRAEGGPPAPP